MMKHENCTYCMDEQPLVADWTRYEHVEPRVSINSGSSNGRWFMNVCMRVLDEAEYEINYCPMCGRKLKGASY